MRKGIFCLLLLFTLIACEKEEIIEVKKIDIAAYPILNKIYPEDATGNHFYFLDPYVVTNYKHNEVLTIGNRKFKPIITTALVRNNTSVPVSNIFKGDTIIVKTTHFLERSENYELRVEATWMESADGTYWSPSKNEEGKLNIERQTVLFTTTPYLRADYYITNTSTANLSMGSVDPLSSFSIVVRTDLSHPQIRAQFSATLQNSTNVTLDHAGYWENNSYHLVPRQIMKSNEAHNLTASLTLEYFDGTQWGTVPDAYNSSTLTSSLDFTTKNAIVRINSITLGSDPNSYSIYASPLILVNHFPNSNTKNYRPQITAALSSNGHILSDRLEEVPNTFNQLHIVKDAPLPANSQVNFNASVRWNYWDGTAWTAITEEGSTSAYNQNFDYTLKTGSNISNSIAKENILYSYPIDRQYHFLKAESTTGYVKLKYRQEGLEELISTSSSLRMIIEPVPSTGTTYYTTNLNYNAQQQEFSFEIPQELTNEKVYKLSLVAVKESPQVMYEMHFRTSMFNTWSQKIEGLQTNIGWIRLITNRPSEIGQTLFGPETFDKFELAILTHLEADLSTDNHFNETIYPLLYENYANLPIQISWRKIMNSNPIPSKASMYLRTPEKNLQLTDADIASGSAPRRVTESAAMQELDYYYWRDLNDYRSQLQAKYDETNEWMYNIRNFSWTTMPSGDYPYWFIYTLPGKSTPSSKSVKVVRKVW